MSVIDIIAGIGLLLLSVTDIRKKMIPVWVSGALGVLLLACRLWQGVDIGSLTAGILPGIVVLALAACSEGKIGMGDGLVLCALGFGYSLDSMLGMLGSALVFSAMAAIFLIVFRKAGRNKTMPFIPYLFAGYLLCVLTG